LQAGDNLPQSRGVFEYTEGPGWRFAFGLDARIRSTASTRSESSSSTGYRVLPKGLRTIDLVEEVRASQPPSLVHPGWSDAYPWLVNGTTTRGDGPEPFDLGLFGAGSPTRHVEERWEALRVATESDEVVHARQLHGREVRIHEGGGEGLVIVDDADAHVTDRPGVLLAVTAADCVPVSIVDPERRVVAMVHAGWRGVAAGVLRASVSTLAEAFGSEPADLRVHLGPAICGRCYQVGPEVFEALGLAAPVDAMPIDLRAVLKGRAVGLGIPDSQVTISAHCTLCTGTALFSHRGGDLFRHVGFIGIRSS
jgi:YfiH family protein